MTTDYNTYESKAVIVATGAKPRELGISGEAKLLGKGVYYCAICDGPFYAGKDVVLVGDANSAMQYALMLAGYCKKVTMVTLFDKLFGEKSIQDAIKRTPNIELVHNKQALKFVGEDKLEEVVFKDTKTDKEFDIKADAVFVAIGQVPDTKIFAD